MESKLWNQVDNQAVLSRPPQDRDQFLRHACSADKALEREVQSLLSSERQAGSFEAENACRHYVGSMLFLYSHHAA